MKHISIDDLLNKVSYNDYTAFVYNDGTQTMYSGGEISDDALHSFFESGDVCICNMGDLPKIKELMQENLLAEFMPASNVADEGYESMKDDFAHNRGEIAYCEYNGTTTYMLIW